MVDETDTSLELEEDLGHEIEQVMRARISELEPRRRRPELLMRMEVSSIAEAVAKALLAAGWRRR